MADQNNTNNSSAFDSLFTNNQSNSDDISQRQQSRRDSTSYQRYLSSINEKLDKFEREFKSFSQSYANDVASDRRNKTNQNDWKNVGSNRRQNTVNQPNRRNTQSDDFEVFDKSFKRDFDRKKANVQKDFLDGIDEVFSDALGLSKTEDILKESLNKFAKNLGIQTEDVPYELGKKLSEEALSIFNNLPISSTVADRINKSRDRWMQASADYFDRASQQLSVNDSAEVFKMLRDDAAKRHEEQINEIERLKSENDIDDTEYAKQKKRIDAELNDEISKLSDELISQIKDSFKDEGSRAESRLKDQLDIKRAAGKISDEDYESQIEALHESIEEKLKEIDESTKKKLTDLNQQIDDVNLEIPNLDTSPFEDSWESDLEDISTIFSEVKDKWKNSDIVAILKDSKLGTLLNSLKTNVGNVKTNASNAWQNAGQSRIQLASKFTPYSGNENDASSSSNSRNDDKTNKSYIYDSREATGKSYQEQSQSSKSGGSFSDDSGAGGGFSGGSRTSGGFSSDGKFTEDSETETSDTIKSGLKDILSSINKKGFEAAGKADFLKNAAFNKIDESALGRIGASLLSKFAPELANTLLNGSLSALIGSAGGPLGILASIALEGLTTYIEATLGKSFNNVKEGFNDLLKSLSSSLTRAIEQDKKNVELGNQRLQADLKSIVEKPFKILEDAAQEIYDAWDHNLRLINQTQGYTKEELNTLMSTYASKLQEEGLSKEIDAASIIENLSKVVESGLQGDAATQFAYEATKLGSAIPTEDFFKYSDAYSELIANQIRMGSSQAEAIKYANDQLELFASDIAYASRQLTGGFATGLDNASDLFTKAINISVAARTNNPSEIAGTLTSISAITGAIAPDLANEIVDAVYNAAVGGNSSQLVALRSLAGINASNTEFLQEFAANPQQVFSDLFNKLAELQNMSQSNYMEVAEGLSEIFGLSKDALSRVDFSYLADAVQNMQVNTSSLQENIAQLSSGNSTTTAEQMKMDQINQYILDNGLSYVLDNAVAREVQQHMWDEQIAQQLQDNEYAVNLKGDALGFLNSIVGFVQSIVNFLNPFSQYNPINSLVQTITEATQLDDTVKNVLEAGKIGETNSAILSNLTTYGKQLNLTNSYLSLLQKSQTSGSGKYTWGTLSKSRYASLGTEATGAQISRASNSSVSGGSNSSQAVNTARLQSNFNKMLADMPNYFNSTVDKKVQSAISDETSKLAKQYVNAISESVINSRVDEYMSNPEEYGIGNISYTSRLANASEASGLSTFNEDVQARSRELVQNKVKSDLTSQAEDEAYSTAYAKVMTQAYSGKYGQTGYNAWLESASKYGIDDIEATLKELGYTDSDVENYYNALNTELAKRADVERDEKEEEFWSEVQRSLELANTNIYDIFDKGDVMGIFWPGVDSWMSDIDSQGTSGGKTVGGSGFRGEMNEWFNQVDTDINSFHEEMITQFKEFRTDWTNYYIKHTTYNEHLTGTADGKTLLTQLEAVQNQKDKTTEDVINSLTEALSKNPIGDLLDPTVQTNVFLSAILQGVQTIIQQNNTQGKLKLPDAIAALATGMTVSTNSSTDV